MKAWLIGLLSLCLAACASPMRVAQDLPAREVLRDFSIEARFAIRLARVGEPLQHGNGRLIWHHENGLDRMFLASPLGSGLAEITFGPAGGYLKDSQGREYADPDPEALLLQVTGYALPLRHLSAWLLGQAGPRGELERDSLGRPLRLREAGWQIDYRYEDALPNALPGRLSVQQADQVGLQLRIESWQGQP